MSIHRVSGLYWEGCENSSIEAWMEIIIHSLLCFVILVCILLFLWIFICNKNPPCNGKSSNNSISNETTLVILLGFCVFFTFLYIYSIYIIATFGILVLNIRYTSHWFYRTLCINFIVFQRSLVYVFMLIRLQRAFKGTSFEVSTNKLKISSIFIIAIFNGIQGVDVYASYKRHHLLGSGDVVLLLLITGGLVDISISTLLTYAFVWRLRMLLRQRVRKQDDVAFNVKYIAQKVTILS